VLCLETQGRGIRAFLRDLTLGQLVMTVALLPLTQWFFGEASLVGALSNLFAVPIVSFVIVPCALIGVLLLLICPPLATPVLQLAAWLTHMQWWVLERTATWPGAHWFLPEVKLFALVLAIIGAAWLFMPRGVPLRALGALLFLPLIWPCVSSRMSAHFRHGCSMLDRDCRWWCARATMSWSTTPARFIHPGSTWVKPWSSRRCMHSVWTAWTY
jgi:hypothetical protein